MTSTPNSYYILGIDPGLATGLCLIDWSDRDNPSLVWSKEVDIPEFYKVIPETLEEFGDKLTVVCENFIITVQTAKKTPAPWSLELIGLTRYLTFTKDIPLVLQKPDERNLSTHPMIKHFGLWHRGGEGHAVQAIRHAFAYMLTHHKPLAKIAINVL